MVPKLPTAIVEDDPRVRKFLETAISQYTNLFSLVESTDSVEKLQTKSIEVLFADVQLGEKNFFELYNHLPFRPSFLVIVSGNVHWAIEGYKWDAIYFLLKPIDPYALLAIEKKILEKLNKQFPNQNSSYQFPLEQWESLYKGQVAIPNQQGIRLVPLSQIIYLKADGSYTSVYCTENSTFISSFLLKDFENLLTEGFIRCHRSYIVSLQYCKEIHLASNPHFVLTNGNAIPIAKNQLEEVKKRIQKYFFFLER